MGKNRIFIVDDDPVFVKLLRHNFDMQKVRGVVDFGSGEACLAALHKRPSLILLDFSMQGLNGLDVLKKIKSESPKTEVIILTALQDSTLKSKCMDEGASNYIVKDEEGMRYLKEELIPKYKPTGIFSLFN